MCRGRSELILVALQNTTFEGQDELCACFGILLAHLDIAWKTLVLLKSDILCYPNEMALYIE